MGEDAKKNGVQEDPVQLREQLDMSQTKLRGISPSALLQMPHCIACRIPMTVVLIDRYHDFSLGNGGGGCLETGTLSSSHRVCVQNDSWF